MAAFDGDLGNQTGEEDGQVQEEQTDEEVSAADRQEGADSEEAPELGPEEPAKEEAPQQENAPGESFTIKVNKEERTCTREEIISLAQKGADYDRVKEQRASHKEIVLTYFFRSRETGTIWCAEATEKCLLRKAYDTKMTMYPLVWLSWDYIPDCYHGQAMITGLIPNQKFINKMFAMVGISLMTTAFPKVIYDRNRIRSWDGSVGSAVGVNCNVDGVAKTIDGASVSPQIGQFIEMAIDKTQTFLGASDVAMGDSRPDNTSAIIALQRAANTPMEMTKQNMHQCVDDLALIWRDMMTVR